MKQYSCRLCINIRNYNSFIFLEQMSELVGVGENCDIEIGHMNEGFRCDIRVACFLLPQVRRYSFYLSHIHVQCGTPTTSYS